MLQPRYRKIIRDITSNKGRTFLVVLAIAVGVFAFGSVFITQELLLKNIDDSYIASNPSTITFSLGDFDKSLVSWITNQDSVKDAQGKAVKNLKVEKNGKEEFMSLIAVDSFSKMELNKLILEKGSYPRKTGEVVLERNSFRQLNYSIGDDLEVKDSKGTLKKLTISGVVYDNSAIPYIFSRQITAFTGKSTIGMLGFSKLDNSLEISVTDNIKTLDDAEKLSEIISSRLVEKNLAVNGAQVAKPNQHWATDNSKAFTAILSVIGSFSLLLSGFLVVNTVSALLAQQKKQIGIMKAVGAKRSQIINLYLLTVGFYGGLGLLLALPMSLFLGYVFLKLVTDFLNLSINSFFLPLNVFLMEFVAALAIPTVAALIPIIASSKRSVREALSDYQSSVKAGLTDRILAKFGNLSGTILLSVRNVFRKKGRLILTLGTLTIAGSLFMAVLNVRQGMYSEMDRILSMYDFQVSLNLGGDYPVENITNRLTSIPGVSAVEGRTGVGAKRVKKDGSKSAGFNITGLDPQTIFSNPVIFSGRWLEPGDKDKIVLSTGFLRDNSDLSIGDNLEVEIDNEKHNFTVVGVIVMSGDQKDAFTDFSTAARIKDKPNLASSYLIKTRPDDAKTQQLVSDEAEEILKRSGITVGFKQTKSEIISGASNQFNFLIFFLLAMAVMVASVGGLGLAGTMSLNVLERTREIGIMRSVGAGDPTVKKTVLIEGFSVGIVSFLIAIPLSIPMTYGFCYAIGNAFFGRTLYFTVVPSGMTIWLMIVLLIAFFASLVPAVRASKMSISQTLSYE